MLSEGENFKMGNDKKTPELIVNTSTSCFFCYDEIRGVKHRPLLFSLKSMCRLLRVNLSKKVLSLNGGDENEKSSLPPISGKRGGDGAGFQVKVSLCEGCWLISGRFSRLHRELEAVRMKLGICLEAIDKRIMGADKSPELVEGYQRKLEWDPEAKRHSKIVAELRKEIMSKYQSYYKRSQPRVKIRRSDSGGLPTITSKKESDLRRISLLKKILARKENGKVKKATVTPPIPTFNNELEGHMASPPQSPEELIRVDDEDIEDPQTYQLPPNPDLRMEPEVNQRVELTPGLGPLHPDSHPPNQSSTSTSLSQLYSFSCELCCSPFPTRQDLGDHVTRVHASIYTMWKFNCDICQKSFMTGGHLNLHQAATHADENECRTGQERKEECSSKCPGSEKDDLPLEKPPLATPDIPTFTLKKGESVPSALPSQLGHSAPKKIIPCVDLRSLLQPPSVPKARLQTPSNLQASGQKKASSSSQAAAPPFNCHLCPKSFSTNRAFAIHDSRVHDSYAFKRKILSKFDCDICYKPFYNGKDLRVHREAVHTGLFICKYCDMECLSLDALYNHNMNGCSRNPRRQKISDVINLNATRAGEIPVVDIDMDEGDNNPPQLCNNSPMKIATVPQPEHPQPGAPGSNSPPASSTATILLTPNIFIMTSAPQPPPNPTPHKDNIFSRPSPYPCRLCIDSFPTKEELISHIKTRHLDDPRLQTMFSDISQRSSIPVVTSSSTHPSRVAEPQQPIPATAPRGEGFHQYFPCSSCKKIFASQDWLSKHERLHCQAPNRNGSLVLIGPSGQVTPSLGSTQTVVGDQNTLQFFRGDDDNDQAQDDNHVNGDPDPNGDPSMDADDPAEPILEEVIDYDFDVKPGDDYADVDPLA